MREALRLLAYCSRTLGALVDLLLTATFLYAFVAITFFGGGGCKDIVIFLLPPLAGLVGLVTEVMRWGLLRAAGERPDLHRSLIPTSLAAAVAGMLAASTYLVRALPLAAIQGGTGVVMLLFVAGSLWRVADSLRSCWATLSAGTLAV